MCGNWVYLGTKREIVLRKGYSKKRQMKKNRLEEEKTYMVVFGLDEA